MRLRWQTQPSIRVRHTARLGLLPLLIAHSAAAEILFPGFVGEPEAHYWYETPGMKLSAPQHTVRELFDKDAPQVSLDQIHSLGRPNLLQAYEPRTDHQLAEEEAQRETISSRFGESDWGYGWDVGLRDIRLRLSYDF